MSNFPDSPSLNEVYISENGITYTWDGEKWTAPGNGTSGGGGGVVVQPTRPTGEIIQTIAFDQITVGGGSTLELVRLNLDNALRVYCELTAKWDPSEASDPPYAYDEFNFFRIPDFPNSELRQTDFSLPKTADFIPGYGDGINQSDPEDSNLIRTSSSLRFSYSSYGGNGSDRRTWRVDLVNSNGGDRLMDIHLDFFTYVDPSPNRRGAVFPAGTTDFVNTDPI